MEAENALLLELKDGQNLGWPAIAEAFQQRGWARHRLKNRYRSLKDGTVFWEDSDACWSSLGWVDASLLTVRGAGGLYAPGDLPGGAGV